MIGKTVSWKSKEFISLFIIVFLGCSLTFSHAGMMVVDPASYVYFAEQIAAASKQLTEMKKALATAEDTLDTAKDMKRTAEKSYRSVTGAYNKGKRFVKRFQTLEEMFEENPRDLEGQYKKWMKIGKKGVNLGDDTLDLFLDPEKQIQANFRDPRSPLYNHLQDLDRRFQLRQTSLKNSIAKSESIMAGTGERMNKIKDLAGEIDRTENIKDAQDLTNAFLAEILITLNELLKLNAHMAESEGLLNFAGVDDAVMDSRVSEIEGSEDRANEDDEAFFKGQDKIINKHKMKIIRRGI